MINKAKLYHTLDFWIIFLMALFCLAFLFFCEIIPSDLFISTRPFKNNPEYVYKKDLHKMMVCSNSFYTKNLEKYYEDPERLFDESPYVFKSKFKNKKTAVIILDNVYLVVHRFTKEKFWDLIFSLPFKASDAYRAWHNGQALVKNKINCTKPLFVIEKRFGPYCTTSYLVTNYITGLHGASFFQENSAFKEKWLDAADNLQAMLLKLEAFKMRHLHFSLDNIILKDEIPYLIDLDRLRKFRFKAFLRKKSLPRYYFSSLEDELKDLKSEALPIFHQKSLLFSP